MTNRKFIKRNLTVYYAYTVFSSLLIIGPIITLYLFEKGLQFSEIMLLNSISALAVVVFEVPTGAIADRLGRKFSLLLGTILWIAALSIYIIGQHFYVLIAAEVIFALGMTFGSGADVALLYDSLKYLGRETEFQQIEGKAKSFSLYALAVGSIAAGFTYKLYIHLPMLLSILFLSFALITCMYFSEVPMGENERSIRDTYWNSIKGSARYIIHHEKLKALILYCMVFYIFYRSAFFFYQPYMQAVHIPVEFFGIIFFFFNLVAAFTSKRSYLIMEKTKGRTLLFLSSLLIVSFVLLGTVKVWVGVTAILLQQIVRGLYGPVTTKFLNKQIPSDKRATILSFVSLLTNLAGALSYPILGIIKDHSTVFETHWIMAISMLLLTYLASQYMKKRIGLKAIKEEVPISAEG